VDVLVTGATGFVGGQLVPRLLADGHRVRALVRDPRRLTATWKHEVEVVVGRVEERQAVLRAADGAATRSRSTRPPSEPSSPWTR
jgi:uncharacterized protein YbjT (DUF2867 family)